MTELIAATVAHGKAMAAMHAAAFPAGQRWGADALGLQLSLPGAFGWLAGADGFVLARIAADEAEILTLAVVPARRRLGLAKALLLQAMLQAAARGAVAMLLEVAEPNAAARALYAGMGFVPVGRRRGYYAGGVDALVLRRDLPLTAAAATTA
jgi:ribosomal-protein-alanine N-acetyltransferase